MTNVQENRIKIFTFLALLATSVFALGDIVIDMKEGIPLMHLVHEGALWILALTGAIFQYRIINWQNKEMLSFKAQIVELDKINLKLKLDQDQFKKKISHLSDEFLLHIDEQFTKWSFTRGEKEIALLLIKGLSMREIADIRGSSENTVRQQSSQIYKKSELNGRMELSAFFLDDLLSLSKLPQEK